jgi:glycopeptide antibiotics resistance protein
MLEIPSWWLFPVVGSLAFIGILITIVLVGLWVWMLVDCAQRNFKNKTEKIVWLLIIVLGGWVGAVIYYIVIRAINKHGIL